MHPLLSLSVFWLLPLALTLEEDSPLDHVPRRTVPYHSEFCVTLSHSYTIDRRLIGKEFSHW